MWKIHIIKKRKNDVLISAVVLKTEKYKIGR